MVNVFKTPTPIVAGHIILAPPIFPREVHMCVYLANGAEKQVVLHGQMTSSPEAWKRNLHGFAYGGDTLDQSDLAGTVLISNVSYAEALRIYHEYLRSGSDTQ